MSDLLRKAMDMHNDATDRYINCLKKQIAVQASRIAALEAAIDHLSTFPTSDADVHILYLSGENPFYIEVMSESGNVKFKGQGKTLLDAINNITALNTEGE